MARAVQTGWAGVVLRIYDEFLEDDTILSLKALTYKLHVSALIYCSRNLTDGEVTEKAAKVLQVILGYPVKRHITELVEAEVWIPIVTGGHLIRNYLEFNPDAATVKQERAKGRDRMRKLREKRAGSPERADERDDEGDGARDGAAPPLPVPALSFEDLSQRPLDDQIGKELKALREAS